jgi:hypothetical protein
MGWPAVRCLVFWCAACSVVTSDSSYASEVYCCLRLSLHQGSAPGPAGTAGPVFKDLTIPKSVTSGAKAFQTGKRFDQHLHDT